MVTIRDFFNRAAQKIRKTQDGYTSQNDKPTQRYVSNGDIQGLTHPTPYHAHDVIIGRFSTDQFETQEHMNVFINRLVAQGYQCSHLGSFMGYYNTKRIHINKPNHEYIITVNDGDVEQRQREFISMAENDLDALYRQSSVANIYLAQAYRDPDSWMNKYSDMVVDFFTYDADVQNAKKHWSTMSNIERQKFIAHANDKIRGLIAERVPNAEINLIDKTTGYAAAYAPQRQNNKNIQTDIYYHNTTQDFEYILENLIHENKHYAQDLGLTDLPTWLIKSDSYNNYISVSENAYMYHNQPVEREVRAPSRADARNIVMNIACIGQDILPQQTSDAEFIKHIRKYNVTDDKTVGTSVFIKQSSEMEK